MIGSEASLAVEQERLRWRHERVKFRPPSASDVVRRVRLGQTSLVWTSVVKMSRLSMTGTACLMHAIACDVERQRCSRTVIISSL